MTDEHALIAQLEATNTEDLVHLILQASAEDEKVLRTYFGNERFRRLRNLVLRREMVRNERRTNERINVVVIPSVLGSELTAVDRAQQQERIWLNPAGIVAGHLDRLRLNLHGLAEANTEHAIHVTGIMKRHYGELMLKLAEHCDVQAFWYDWRKDYRLAAAELQARIDSWFPTGEPVHLVAHGVGGLVARAYIHQFPQRWDLGGSKLIMIGTPNYGLYTALQALTGHLGLVRWVNLLDSRPDHTDFREILKSFPSFYQLLPAPGLDFAPGVETLYDAATYGTELNVSQEHLTQALQFHAMLRTSVVDPRRMIYLAGHNQPTFIDVNSAKIKNFEAHRQPTIAENMAYLQNTYRLGLNGDGTVPHIMGVLRTPEGKLAPAYYIEAPHGDLYSHPKVLMALDELLTASKLSPDEITQRCGLQPLTTDLINNERSRKMKELWQNMLDHRILEDQQPQMRAALIHRSDSRSNALTTQNKITVEEREIADRLLFGFLSGDAHKAQNTYGRIDLCTSTIRINLVASDITDNELRVQCQDDDEVLPIDVLAIGHYLGDKPYGLLRTLDYKLSHALARQRSAEQNANRKEEDASESAAQAKDEGLLLTQYAQRGTIRGELAQLFFLTDPRNANRMIAIAGMGEPGCFGQPELTVLVRELCWSLGRMGKKHLATVLIGTGRDNLSLTDAITGWIRGIRSAIIGVTKADPDDDRSQMLDAITFFVIDPSKVLVVDNLLRREQIQLQKQAWMNIHYTPLDIATQNEYKNKIEDYVRQQRKKRQQQTAHMLPLEEVAPTRVTVRLDGNRYYLGAMTELGSTPEREALLDPALVRRANDELMAETDLNRQIEIGKFMQQLLIPTDVRQQFCTNAQLVMRLDIASARIHWELLAQPDLTSEQVDIGQEYIYPQFFGLSRGLTRQLRTVRVAPESLPPARRNLRVLVVADPAVDTHLPGAEEEGIVVADLFEQFNIVYSQSPVFNHIEVVRLFGPREATRTTVLRHLLMRTYDVLHFAGHCVYDVENPAASGWVFSNGERLSAYDFRYIDHSPTFVFSNACELGINPTQANERSVDLAPSLAEAFFARGVTNFVCIAWPVQDRAARDFALTLYAGLLGLEPTSTKLEGDERQLMSHITSLQPMVPLAMHQAMLLARRAIAVPTSDTRTWAAYQHYGNPHFRFFDPAGFDL